ncbi:hypothetical protein [Pseudomonas sp. LS-2]|uniref:hypothetical protein n=1 Tax=Pseudomonas sp. LS-2 TaxID=2315859 RepID=UPI000E71C0E7|nr:hypothetical protein [Pseudomonas sp. LS-2]RJX82292.1 hypothetical protein D3M70_06890 [Pseudomonas sp. LS-2]
MSHKRRIVIKNGVVAGFADELSLEGLDVREYAKNRVSHVVPRRWPLRMAFAVLRGLVADKSRIASWTRTWNCDWTVIIKDEAFGPFTMRERAIEFEKKHIYQQGALNGAVVGVIEQC